MTAISNYPLIRNLFKIINLAKLHVARFFSIHNK